MSRLMIKWIYSKINGSYHIYFIWTLTKRQSRDVFEKNNPELLEKAPLLIILLMISEN